VMEKIYGGIKSFFQMLFVLFAKSSEWILFILALIIFYDVCMRYLFTRPTIWALEISEYLLVYLCFAGITEAQRRKAHIKMGFFYTKFPKGVQLHLNLLFVLLTVIFSLLICIESYKLCITAYTLDSMSNTLLETPLVIPYALVPLGMTFLTLQSIFDTIESIGEIIGYYREGRA
jgi:TRAP-type C4-dicarboxylate transport system permease small subunit